MFKPHCHQIQLVVKKICEPNEESIEFFENVRTTSYIFNKSMKSKKIVKKCTGESLPAGSSTRCSYFGRIRTLNKLVSYFNQYKTCLKEIYTKSKGKKLLKKLKKI